MLSSVACAAGATRIARTGLSLLGAALLLAACAAGGGSGSRVGQTEGAGAAPRIGSGVFSEPARGVAPAIGRGVPVEPGVGATVALLAPVGDGKQPVRALAQGLANAAQLALTDRADSGLTLRVYDTKGTPEGAAAAAQAAVADRAAVILGPLYSGSVSAAKPIAASAGLTMIAFSSDSAVAGGGVFLNSFLLEGEIDRVVSYAANGGVRNLGALTRQTQTGDIALRAIQAAAARNGAQLAASQSYQPGYEGIESGVQIYAETHKSRAELDPIQGVVLVDRGWELQTLGAYLAFLDITQPDVRFLGASGWNSPETLRETALRGGWFAAPDPRLQEAFAERYAAAFGAAPNPLAALSYDAAAAAAVLAVEARGRGERFPFSVEAISDPAGFSGVSGAFRFRPDGLNDRGLAILEVAEDGFRVIDPAPTSFASF
ncbi:MAG: penicillin-binding protein activator [Pseudomonadota bacterium]